MVTVRTGPFRRGTAQHGSALKRFSGAVRASLRFGTRRTRYSTALTHSTTTKSGAGMNDGLIKLVLIGDVHRAWDPVQDAAALAYLKPDAAIFVGDFGEEVVDLVGHISRLPVPKAVILGNHDAWGPLYRGQSHEEVHKQMDLLGKDHVGYSSKSFTAASGQRFSVVGARPFSDGNRTMDCCVRSYYNVKSMAASAHKVAAEIERQPPGEAVIVVGHNGPAGLGRLRHDPCGKDFMPEEGDYGDQDLRSALDAASSSGRAVPLVVFGHMHQALHYRYGKGRRNMVQIDGTTGTVYLNCAVVPRERYVPGKGERASHFVVATLEGGLVIRAENVWVQETVAGGFSIWKTEELLVTEDASDGGVSRRVFHAFDSAWSEAVPLASSKRGSRKDQAAVEL